MNSLLSNISVDAYWPSSFNQNLDQFVAYLFCQTKSKIMTNLINKSQVFLTLDLVLPHTKKKLLVLVLQEFENLLLDIAEAELSISDIYFLNSKLLYDLIYKSRDGFMHNILHTANNSHAKICMKDLYIRSVIKDNKVFLGNVIVYLLYGQSKYSNISFQYIEVLFHNLIIKISDLVLFLTLNREIRDIPVLCSVLSSKYRSMRSLEELYNNIIYQNVKYFYVDQPRAIYSNKYQVVLLSSSGILDKTISVSRIDELNNLSYIQLLSPSLLEIQDFFIPRLKYIIFVAGRIIIYFGFSIINNLVQFFFYIFAKSIAKLAQD